MRPLCYVEKHLWQQVFSEHFKSFSTYAIRMSLYSTCMYHIHACTQDKNFHFHKIVPFWWKHLVSFFFKMVSRSPGNVLRGKQKETGAKQSRPRETGVLLQLRCHADDWQPSAVDTQLPRWLFRSSVPTPSKAHN